MKYPAKTLATLAVKDAEQALREHDSEMLALAPGAPITGSAGTMLARLAISGLPKTARQVAASASRIRRKLRGDLKQASQHVDSGFRHCDALAKMADYIDGEAPLPQELPDHLKAAAAAVKQGIKLGVVDPHFPEEIREMSLRASQRLSESDAFQRVADKAALASARQTRSCYEQHAKAARADNPKQVRRFGVMVNVAAQVEKARHDEFARRWFR